MSEQSDDDDHELDELMRALQEGGLWRLVPVIGDPVFVTRAFQALLSEWPEPNGPLLRCMVADPADPVWVDLARVRELTEGRLPPNTAEYAAPFVSHVCMPAAPGSDGHEPGRDCLTANLLFSRLRNRWMVHSVTFGPAPVQSLPALP